jgi:aminoglycoside 6'-N-acetyltransferase
MSDAVSRTWDGLEIAAERPTGSTVVVRRTGSSGEREVLLLHRSGHGPDFDGDWAWTSPAGCRQPGEAVYPAALRELAEEAGLDGPAPWAVDLSSSWALFAVDVPYDVSVNLVDPEHDRYEWLSPERAGRRVLPNVVARGLAKAVEVPVVDLGFRRMRNGDLDALARWQSAPHVAAWWDSGGRDLDAVRTRYSPRLRGDEPVRMWVVEMDGHPVGFAQDYRVRDQPEYAHTTQGPEAVAFDYAIGEPTLVGRGLGTRMVWQFCRDVLRRDYPDVGHLLASPSHRNAASLRVLDKCGFDRGRRIANVRDTVQPPDDEIVCTLDVRHWLG